MATKYDAIQNRINMQTARHEQMAQNTEGIATGIANAIKAGASIVQDIGSQVGTQQAQDWLKARQTAYDEADVNGDFLKDADGNILTDFNDIQKRRDEWLEAYSKSNPVPKNIWAQKAIDNANATGTELSDAKLATSAIKQLQKQQNDLIADNEESIIGTSISNPASYNETLLANYGAKYDSLDDTQKGWYDDGSEIGSKRLALSLMYNANGINKNNSDFRIAVLNDDIENSYWLDNWASAYQANCLDSNSMTDEQFWKQWESEANNESLKPNKGYFDSSRKDYIRKQLEAKTKSLLNAKKESVGNLYNEQAVPAINGMYEASKNSAEGAGFRYPNTETINEVLSNLGIESRFLPDEVNKSLDNMKESGDAVSACVNAVHKLNEISGTDMPEDDKVAEFVKYKATLSPSTVSSIEKMADLDPYYGKYSQMSDRDIYEHMMKISSPLLEKANMSDAPIVDTDAIEKANKNAFIENNKGSFIKERAIIDNYNDTKVVTQDVQDLIDKEKSDYPSLSNASDTEVLAHIDVRLGNDEIALRNAGVKAEELSTATKAMKSALGRYSEEAEALKKQRNSEYVEANKDTFVEEKAIIGNYNKTKVITPDVQTLIDKEKANYPSLADASDTEVLAHIDVRLGYDETALRNAGAKAEELSTEIEAMKSALGRINAEAFDEITSKDIAESRARLYIALGDSDSSVLEAGLVSSLKQGYMEAHISEIEEYARDTGRDFDDVLDELFADYSKNLYNSAKAYFDEYGNIENSDLEMTPNEYLEEKQAVYSNLMNKMVETGSDGRPYFPANGISTAGLSNPSKRWVEEQNRGHIKTANETQKKLMDFDNQDQRLAFFNNTILPNSSLYTEEEVDRWRGIANGDYGKLLADNGIKISDYTSMLGSSDSKSNTPIMDRLEYEIGALVPAYYKNGQFDKTGFDNAAKRKATSLIGSYADSVYFKDKIEFDITMESKDKRKNLLGYIGSPVSDIPEETISYTNDIIANAAKGQINNGLSILLANSTIVDKDTRALLTKAFDEVTLTRIKSLSDEDRKGYALEGVLTDLGFSFNYGYSMDGDNSNFYDTAYGYISELGTSSRNMVLSSVNYLYTVSNEATAIEKAGMSIGSKSANDNSYISEDRKTTYVPVYDVKGNVSFDVYNKGSDTKIGNTKYISDANLGKLSKMITSEVRPIAERKIRGTNHTLNDAGIPIRYGVGNIPLIDIDDSQNVYEETVNAFIENSSSKVSEEFKVVNELYKATHNGKGLKLVLITGATAPVVKIIEDKEND